MKVKISDNEVISRNLKIECETISRLSFPKFVVALASGYIVEYNLCVTS